MARTDVLALDKDQLQSIRQALRQRIAEGLQRDGAEIAALPAYFSPPQGRITGEALVVDIGGTNVRAAHVALRAGGDMEFVAGPEEEVLLLRDPGHPLDREGFFAFQAELVARLAPPSGLPLGYCFSYPSRIDPSRDAHLLAWTKGIDIAGVVGTRVGLALRTALERRDMPVTQVRVLNDTVAALLGGALSRHSGAPEGNIGLICGTGTNIAAFFPLARATKLGRERGSGSMAFNLESGNFTPPHLTALDDAVDRASDNPGQQRFEKAVSGYYLPYIFNQLCPQAGSDPSRGSEELVRLAGEGGMRGEAAAALLGRSADLTAAGLAGVVDHLRGEGPFWVQAEGSLFWRAPGFAQRVGAALAGLLGPSPQVLIGRAPHINLLGAAYAALAP